VTEKFPTSTISPRSTGKPGVVLTHLGPGLTNAATVDPELRSVWFGGKGYSEQGAYTHTDGALLTLDPGGNFSEPVRFSLEALLGGCGRGGFDYCQAGSAASVEGLAFSPSPTRLWAVGVQVDAGGSNPVLIAGALDPAARRFTDLFVEASTGTVGTSVSADAAGNVWIAGKADERPTLWQVPASGPAGRVIKRDVESTAVPPTARWTAPTAPLTTGFTDVPLTQIRKTIAKRLAQSLGPIPHFFLTTEIEMERAWDARQALKVMGEQYTVSFNDLVVKAVALALRQHPAVNAWWMGDRIRYHGDVHVGMAVAVEDGLITPVIRHADRKGLAEIAAEGEVLRIGATARHRTVERSALVRARCPLVADVARHVANVRVRNVGTVGGKCPVHPLQRWPFNRAAVQPENAG